MSWRDDCICARCNSDYDLTDGCEPSKYCNRCVHDVVDELESQLGAADRLAQKVMALRADQNSWPKEEEVYEAMVAYRTLRAAAGKEPP